MFRFDNPDALLVLLLVGAAYCMTRAIEKAGTKWLLAVGTLLGFAFLTKMMQAFTVVPAFGLAYMIAAPTSLRRRAGQLLGSLVALVVAGGWWVVIVSLVPAADRPFIDGSPDNSIWNLIFDYNGFGRLTGSGTGGGANFSGTAGVFRLFNDAMGGQASWLLPAALVGFVAVMVARRSGTAHGQGAGGGHHLGRVAAGHRRRVQLRQGRHPYLLHGRPGTGHRGPGGYRGVPALEGAGPHLGPSGRGRRGRAHLRLGLGVARPDAFVESGIALAGCCCGRGGRGHDHGRTGLCSGAAGGVASRSPHWSGWRV